MQIKNIIRVLFSLATISLFCVGTVWAVESAPLKATPTNTAGLELPADQTVDTKEGFVLIQAKAKGEVKFLVVSKSKIKYLAYPTSVVVSIPPEPGTVIEVYAVSTVDGHLTDFVKTTITVGGSVPTPPVPPAPNPSPNPPTPNPVNKAWSVTFVLDLNKVTPEMAKILNSPTLRETINQKGHWFRIYDVKSDDAKKYRFDQVVLDVSSKYPGANNAMIIQTPTGVVKDPRPIPASEAEILTIINQTIK